MRNLLSTVALAGIVAVAWYGVYNFESQNVKTSNEVNVVKGKAVSKAPDFSAYNDVDEKKHAFFAYLKPGIALENQRIAKERA